MKGLSILGWCNELGTSTGRPIAAFQVFDQDFLINYFTLRVILCARSNYFSAMLLGGWMEEKSNEITLNE